MGSARIRFPVAAKRALANAGVTRQREKFGLIFSHTFYKHETYPWLTRL